MSSSRSRKLSENRKYHRTQVTIMLVSNRRFRKSSGRGGVMPFTLADSECNTSLGPAKYSTHATVLCAALCLFLLLQWSMAVSASGWGLLFTECTALIASMVGSITAFLIDPAWGFIA